MADQSTDSTARTPQVATEADDARWERTKADARELPGYKELVFLLSEKGKSRLNECSSKEFDDTEPLSISQESSTAMLSGVLDELCEAPKHVTAGYPDPVERDHRRRKREMLLANGSDWAKKREDDLSIVSEIGSSKYFLEDSKGQRRPAPTAINDLFAPKDEWDLNVAKSPSLLLPQVKMAARDDLLAALETHVRYLQRQQAKRHELASYLRPADKADGDPRTTNYSGETAIEDGANDAIRRRGRHRNQGRRDAIGYAIAKFGLAWRDHLSDIFAELDGNDVPLGDFQGREVDLGDGQSVKVLKWDDLDLAQGEQRKQIIDTLRKYAV